MLRLMKYLLSGSLLIAAGFGAWTAWQPWSHYRGPSEELLSDTGFDVDAARRGELENVHSYAPVYPFWSDGAEKFRYVYLPPGGIIDTSNPDRWNFPVGTRLWKVFYRNNILVETRMLFKTGSESGNWDMAVYRPNPDGSDSRKIAFAQSNVSGTPHDVPAADSCVSCHSDGKMRRPLGITAIQLPWEHESQLSVSQLVGMGRLSDPPDQPYVIPGNELTRRTLGYFDTNCGSCHYEGSTYVEDDVPLRMNLTTDTIGAVGETNVYRTAINRPPALEGMGLNIYVKPGKPDESFVFRRLAIRDNGIWQMPPLASEEVDKVGMDLVKRWIESLAP